MTLKELEYFVSVARHQSYTLAAKECFITQPALSRAISELEAELGCTLFRRTTKQVELTPEGRSRSTGSGWAICTLDTWVM